MTRRGRRKEQDKPSKTKEKKEITMWREGRKR